MTEFDWVAVGSARRMYRPGESIEDLEQVPREALLGAVSRFDVNRGVAFKAFAWSTAIGVLRHHYRSRWQLRVPRRIQELHLTTMRAIQDLSAAEGRSPTVDELADHLRVDREDVILALDAGHAYRAGSLDESLNDHQGRPVRQERMLGALDDAIEATADRARVRELLSSLPQRQQEILVMRFFEGRTQTEIGRRLGLSQVHVSAADPYCAAHAARIGRCVVNGRAPSRITIGDVGICSAMSAVQPMRIELSNFPARPCGRTSGPAIVARQRRLRRSRSRRCSARGQ